MLKQISVLRLWANAVESEALHRLLRGDGLPGFKLVESRANRKWADRSKVMETLKGLKLSEDEYAPRALISPAQAEALLKKLKRKSEFQVLSSLVERPRGKPTIALDTDPRPEMVRGEEFTDESLEKDETDEG